MNLSDLTFPEVEAALKKGAVALLPTGSTEAHGPHLPLDTDVVIARETCRRAEPALSALGLEALVLPPLAYTVTEYAAPFSGTISIPRDITLRLVEEIIVSIAGHGVKAVCLVNAHLEPAHRFMLRDAVKAARTRVSCPVIIADPCDRRWVSTLTPEFQSGSCHAGQYETSLVLAADQGRVRARNGLPPVDIDLVGAMKAGQTTFPAMGADRAYFGRPMDATTAEGDDTYGRLVDMVVTMVKEALAERSP